MAANDVKGTGGPPNNMVAGAPETHTMEPTEAPKERNGATRSTGASKGHTTTATEDERI